MENFKGVTQILKSSRKYVNLRQFTLSGSKRSFFLKKSKVDRSSLLSPVMQPYEPRSLPPPNMPSKPSESLYWNYLQACGEDYFAAAWKFSKHATLVKGSLIHSHSVAVGWMRPSCLDSASRHEQNKVKVAIVNYGSNSRCFL